MNNYVGRILRGFCNGFFGRESYDDKIVVADGDDWIVAKNMRTGETEFAHFDGGWKQQMNEFVRDWSE